MKEINYFLAEGLEAKELLPIKNQSLRLDDSIIGNLSFKVGNLNAQIIALKENEQVANDRWTECRIDLSQEVNKKDSLITKINEYKFRLNRSNKIKWIAIIIAIGEGYFILKP